MSTNHVLVLLGVSFLLTTLCPPLVHGALTRVRHITDAAQFTGRQSPRPVIKPIVIKPLDLTGGRNVAAARKAVEQAIARVQAEIEDQQRLVQGFRKRVEALAARIGKLRHEQRSLETLRAQILEELRILKSIPNPTQPILDCIAELEEDLRQVDQQLENLVRAIRILTRRLEFLKRVGGSAHGNLAKLKAALEDLFAARAKLSSLNIATPDREISAQHNLSVRRGRGRRRQNHRSRR